jgi:LmbE family N-acetylglucosaminyl deacetylase/glycosyltransferase involved in cell wall biosynthesis
MESEFIPYYAVKKIVTGDALIFAPHPDDEVFGCGGAIIRHIEQGDNVSVVIVTDGGFPTHENHKLEPYIENRRNESLDAAKILGYSELQFLHYHDRELIANENLIISLLEIIINFKPINIYLPAETEIHPDHKALHIAGKQAVIRYKPELNLIFYEVGKPLTPNILHDITDIHGQLELAMDCFKSQLIIQDYKRHINALHAYRSYTLKNEIRFAEAYFVTNSTSLKPGDERWNEDYEYLQQNTSEKPNDNRYPLISIIVRTMNRPELPEALESIANQTYPNIEVIVIDAKGENNLQLGENCGHFPLLQITRNKPLNRPEAANAGLESINGDYFGFLDEDDLFFPDHIENLYKKLLSSNSPAAYDIVERVNIKNEKEALYNKTFTETSLLMGNFIPNLALLFTRELLDNDIRFDPEMLIYEDWDFLIQVANTGNFAFVNQIGGVYKNFNLSGVQNDTAKIIHFQKKLYQKWLPSLSENQISLFFDHVYHITSPKISNHYVQLFFESGKDIFNEENAIKLLFDKEVYKLIFKLNTFDSIHKLRFDPINDYAQVRINEIKLMNLGNPIDKTYSLSSNAILTDQNVYLFDTIDPQIYIDFNDSNDVEIEEVIVNIEYLRTGPGVLELVNAHKDKVITNQKEAFKNQSETNISLSVLNDQQAEIITGLKENIALVQEKLFKERLINEKHEISIQLMKQKNDELENLYEIQTTEIINLLQHNQELEVKNSTLNNSFLESQQKVGQLQSNLYESQNELINLKNDSIFRTIQKIIHLFGIVRSIPKIRKFIARRRLLGDAETIEKSGLFDEKYYLENNPDVRNSDLTAVEHYLIYGGYEGRKPSDKFNHDLYMNQYPEVLETGKNPLLYYIMNVKVKNTDSQLIKQTQIAGTEYHIQTKEKHLSKINKILEKVKDYNKLQIIGDSSFFDANYYLRTNADVKETGMNPIHHYHYYGWKEGRNPSHLFDTVFYLSTYKDVKQAGIDPLLHFINIGEKEGRLPKTFKINELDCAKQADISTFTESDEKLDFKIAVVCHIYYTGLADELISYLSNIPIAYDLYISTSIEDVENIKDLFFKHLPNIKIQVNGYINRGRDIAPFVRILESNLMEYDLVCKIHTKSSTHDFNLNGWRGYLLDNLLGHPKVIREIFSVFSKNQKIGLIWPVVYPYLVHLGMAKGWGNSGYNDQNLIAAQTHFPELNLSDIPSDFAFPAGSMFWFRPKALINLAGKKFDSDIFEPENHQIDGTLAHAIERLFGIIATKEGFENKTVFFSQELLNKLDKKHIRLPNTKSILFVAHDLFRAGAEMLLLHILQWMHDYSSFNIYVLAIKKGADGGKLLTAYQKVSKVILWEEYCSKYDEYEAIERIKHECGSIDLIYGNTIVSSGMFKLLRVFDAPFISHIHELEQSINKYSTPEIRLNIKEFTSVYIACSLPVEKNLINNHEIPIQKIRCIHEFIKPTLPSLVSRSLQRELLGLPTEKTIVWGCGTIYWRKGTDLFIETAKTLKDNGIDDFIFCWIGENYWNNDSHEWGYWDTIEKYIIQNKLSDTVIFLGESDNPRRYFMAGDVFYLSSREDPFPLVCLEAAECGLPIICFEGAGGMNEFIETDAGFVVPYLDTNEAALAIEKLINNKQSCIEMGSIARSKLLNKYSTNLAVPEILNICHEVMGSSPMVSVIVPVYNHEKYLIERIESILNQSFRDFEIIILDDASTDFSYEVATQFQRHPAIKIIRNDENTGSPFKQWQKGVALAQGKYIWIAEGDDFAESNFLESLLHYFIDEEVSLAYCASHRIDEEGLIDEEYYLKCGHYDNLIYPVNHWFNDYSEIGTDEIMNALAIRNTIPNVSATLWRAKSLKTIDFDKCSTFKNAGDWYAYINLLLKGKVCYKAKHLNYHRVHSTSVVAKNKRKPADTIPDYFEIHKFINQNFDVNDELFHLMTNSVTLGLRKIWSDLSEKDFNKLYDIDALTSIHEQKTQYSQANEQKDNNR